MQFNLETTEIVFLLLMWSILPADGCPDSCLCMVSTKHVSCEGVGLTDPPSDIHPSVTTLDLRRNLLTRLGSDLMAPLANVVRLTLTDNRLENIADDTFRDSRLLQVLELSGNNLTYLTGAAMRGAETLLQLDLSSNRLEKVDGAFHGMRILSRLDLSANRLHRITGDTFRGLSNLRYLLLSGNRISSFEHDAFLDLERLMHLVLKSNPIATTTVEFRFHSPYLSYIDLSECELTRIPRGLPPTLRYLQLRRNNISAVERGSLDACPDLGILVLDENAIHDSASDDESPPFVSISKLQQLWLNFNSLARIPHVTTHVQRLLLESNSITELSNSFPVHSRIDTLSLAGNLISHIESNALHPLTELHTLDLSNNRLASIDGETFAKNTRLKSLQLSRNPLVELRDGCFHGLTSLRQMSLAFISSVTVTAADDIFRDADSLARLDLDSSPGVIRALSASDDLLSSLAGVRELSMRGSNLRTLRSDFPEFFPNLAVFRVSSSRWHCDTSMLWFKVWLAVTSVEVTDAANSNRCNTPPHLRNRSLVFLSDEDFVPTTTTQPTGPHPGQDEDPGPVVTRVVAAPALPDKSRTTLTSDSRVLFSFPLLPEASGQSELDYIEHPASLTLDISPPRSETVTPINNSFYHKIKQRTEITGEHHQSDGKKEPSRTSMGSSSNILVIVIVVSLLVILVVALGIIVSVLLLKNPNHLPQGNATAQKNCATKTGLTPSDGLPSSESANVREITYDSGYFLQQSLSATSTPPPMTLVPGRDINHEGPHRVYTWIDF